MTKKDLEKEIKKLKGVINTLTKRVYSEEEDNKSLQRVKAFHEVNMSFLNREKNNLATENQFLKKKLMRYKIKLSNEVDLELGLMAEVDFNREIINSHEDDFDLDMNQDNSNLNSIRKM
jgi:hypothetical protein